MADFDRNDLLVALGAVLTSGALFMLAGAWAVLALAGLVMVAVGTYRSG